MPALFVICTRITTLDPRYNFALLFHENAFVVSQSEERNFFMYVIDRVIFLKHLPRLHSGEIICVNTNHTFKLCSHKRNHLCTLKFLYIFT